MSQDEKLTNERLDALWENVEIPILDTTGEKYFIISDSHFGNGGGSDDFHKNENTLLDALNHYIEGGYKIILLGDIEELWQFRLSEIIQRYDGSLYKKIRLFGDDNVFRVYGNHDIDWCEHQDPTKNTPLKNTCAVEALKMKCPQGNTKILLVHGHQGSKESDKGSWSSRFWVRAFRIVEPLAKKIGWTRQPSAAKSRIPKNYEKILYTWAKKHGVILICGHSHRAIFSALSYPERLKERIRKLQIEIRENREDKKLIESNLEKIKELHKEYKDEKRRKRLIESVEPDGKPSPCYFNTGCALYSDGITGIEIEDNEIRLAKWHRDPNMIPRHEIYENGDLSEFCTQVV